MKRLVELAILTMLLLSVSVMGQDGAQALREVSYGYFGAGARAMAMGNAFVGLSNDVSGGTWNPAGIWVIERPVMSASFLFFIPQGQFNQSLTLGSTNTEINEKSFGHFSFAAPFRISGHPWVFNFNFKRDNDRIYRADFFSGWNPDVNPDVFIKDKSYLHTYSFGFSTRVYKQLSMGITANVYQAKRDIEERYKFAYDELVQALPPLYKHYAVDYVWTDSTTSKGFDLTFGLLYKLDKSMSVGAVVRTPFKMKNNSDLMMWKYVTANGIADATLTESVLVNDSIAKQDMPLSVTVGFALQPNENTCFTLDVNYQKYGSSKWYHGDSTFYRISGEREDVYTAYSLEWKDALGLGVGVEHSLMTQFGRIPFRTGFRVDGLPQPKLFEIMYIKEAVLDRLGEPTEDSIMVASSKASGQQVSYGISFGSGIHWSQIGFDLAYRYTFGAKTEVSSSLYKRCPSCNAISLDRVIETRSEKQKGHDIKVTFTGYF